MSIFSIFKSFLSTQLKSTNTTFQPDTVTENGSRAFSTTLSSNLDFFGTICRSSSGYSSDITARLHNLLPLMWAEDPLLTVKNIFAKRDILNGAGERAIFYNCYNWLFTHHPETAYKNLQHIPGFGYWKDLLNLLSDKDIGYDTAKRRNTEIIKLFAQQLTLDREGIKHNHDYPNQEKKLVTLCAKWAPSLQCSYDKKYKICSKLARRMNLPSQNWQKSYRKMLVELRDYLRVVERQMCDNKWNDINFSTVPSIAMHKYKKAFAKRVPDKFQEWISRIKKGEAKVNAKVLMPHELIHHLDDPLTQSQWNEIRSNTAKMGKLGRMIPICDVSGSMSGIPMDVSIALGILVSELAPEMFRDLMITFSSDPTFFHFKGTTLKEKYNEIINSGSIGLNTNFNKIFTILLQKAITNDIPSEQMPEALLCITDMQFDQCDNGFNTNYEKLKQQYTDAGYLIPKIIFWNVRCTYDPAMPVTSNDKGTCMISGWSPNLLKSVLNVDIPDPWKIMMDAVGNNKLYDCLQV